MVQFSFQDLHAISRSPCHGLPLLRATKHLSLSRSPQCSLRPRRVLVTAPLPYAARLAPFLIARDLRPIIAPTITTTILNDDRVNPLREALLRLHEYKVLACVSRQSITSVATQLLQLCENDPKAAAIALKASEVQIAALGADALYAKQLLGQTADLIPLEASPFGMVKFLRENERLKGAPILCPVPIVSEMQEPDIIPNFLRQLRDAGFKVCAVPAYETRPVERQSLLIELSMLADIDAIVISSTGEALALQSLLTERERSSLLARVKQGELVLAAHGPVTAAGVQSLFSVAPVVSDDYTSFEGVAHVVSMKLSKGSLILPG